MGSGVVVVGHDVCTLWSRQLLSRQRFAPLIRMRSNSSVSTGDVMRGASCVMMSIILTHENLQNVAIANRPFHVSDGGNETLPKWPLSPPPTGGNGVPPQKWPLVPKPPKWPLSGPPTGGNGVSLQKTTVGAKNQNLNLARKSNAKVLIRGQSRSKVHIRGQTLPIARTLRTSQCLPPPA